MNTASDTPPIEKKPGILAGVLKRVAAFAFFFILTPLILFPAAGRIDWVWAWVYLGICLVSIMINLLVMLPGHLDAAAETMAERGELKMTQKWDQIISALYALLLFLALPLVAGLDMRFAWTGDLSLAWHVAGAVAVAAGYELTAWAMFANAYFSTAVRIQSERGHTVCSSGPYRFVRHPGYVGFIIQCIGLPILLGSAWALVPGITAAALMALRTSFEDRMLQAELPGYPDYAQKVRYRLVPGLW